jgi:hypothetical protein
MLRTILINNGPLFSGCSGADLPLPLQRKGQPTDELIRARRPVPWQVRLFVPPPREN